MTQVKSLDMADRGDRSKFREALRRGWKIDPVMRSELFEALDKVVDRAGQDVSTPANKATIIQAVWCLLHEQGQLLKQLHAAERADAIRRSEK